MLTRLFHGNKYVAIVSAFFISVFVALTIRHLKQH